MYPWKALKHHEIFITSFAYSKFQRLVTPPLSLSFRTPCCVFSARPRGKETPPVSFLLSPRLHLDSSTGSASWRQGGSVGNVVVISLWCRAGCGLEELKARLPLFYCGLFSRRRRIDWFIFAAFEVRRTCCAAERTASALGFVFILCVCLFGYRQAQIIWTQFA